MLLKLKKEFNQFCNLSIILVYLDFFFFALILYKPFKFTIEIYIYLRFLNLVSLVLLYLFFKIFKFKFKK